MKTLGYKITKIAILMVVPVLCVAAWTHYVSAEDSNWMNADATITATRNSLASAECDRVSIERVVDSPWQYNGQRQITVNACVTKGKDIDLAIDGNGYPFVKYHSDSVYRILKSEAGGNLVPGTNYYSYIRNTVDYRLRTIEDLATALVKDTEDDLGSVISYRIGPTAISSQFPIANSEGEYHRVFSYQVTSDLRYIAAYVDYAGVVKIDLQSGSVKKVLRSPGSSLYHKYIPNVEAISEDGRFVFMGNSAVILDTEGCGDTLTGVFYGGVLLNDECHSQDFDALIAQEVPYSYRLNKAKFVENGNAVEFIATLRQGEIQGVDSVPRQITLYAHGYHVPTPKLEYLALGDSYSSGEGDLTINSKTGVKFYREHTDDDGTATIEGVTERVSAKEKCHLSTNSYPYKLASGMELGSPTTSILTTKWQSVACSGATAWDVKGQGSDEYEGQSDGDGPRLSNYDVTKLKSQALNEFIPGRQKQIEFVKKYQPKVITLTMGGNDINFGGKLTECASHVETCGYAERGYRTKLKNEIYDQFANLKSLYKELHDATNGESKIYVLGYPEFVNADPAAKCSSKILFLNAEEREMIVNSIIYLNNVIEVAAKNAGVNYIDLENAFGNHRLCDDSESHVNAVAGFAGYRGNELQESFHPNADGHSDIANAVWEYTNGQSLQYFSTCNEGIHGCIVPNDEIKATSAKIPPYFNVYSDDNDATSIYYALTNGTLVKTKKYYTVQTRTYVFEPSSKVDINLYSQPIHLGQFTVDSNGALNSEVSIPQSIPAGYHRLTVAGISPEGRPIEVYQTVLIQGSNSKDVDEDGVSDLEDMCMFGLSVSQDIDIYRDTGCNYNVSSSSTNVSYQKSIATINIGMLDSAESTSKVSESMHTSQSVLGIHSEQSDTIGEFSSGEIVKKSYKRWGYASLVFIAGGCITITILVFLIVRKIITFSK